MATSIPRPDLINEPIYPAAESSTRFDHYLGTSSPLGSDTGNSIEYHGGSSVVPWIWAAVWAFMTLGIGVFAVSNGAPGFFLLFAILMAVLGIASVIASEGKRQRLAQEKITTEFEERERLKSEIADTVKETMKSTIMVRCSYCGSLNDESANKCDSCGASL